MWTPNRVMFTLFGRDFYWYGLLIAIGVLLAVLLAMKLAKRRGYDSDIIVDLSLVALPCAIVGARLYYVLMTLDYYSGNWIRVLYFWEGGLAIYGGIIGGVLGGFVYLRIKKLPFWDFADIVAPCIALGQAIGRWGNFFNQEAYGVAVTNPKLQFFPIAVYIEALEGTREGPWHMATFFYESIWCLLLVLCLVWLFNRKKKSGTVMLSYAALYGIERAIVEGFRTDSLMMGSIRISQALSIVLVIVCGGILLMQALSSRKPKEVVDEKLRLLFDDDEAYDDVNSIDDNEENNDVVDGGVASNKWEDPHTDDDVSAIEENGDNMESGDKP